jgi:hypothetical protein
MAVGAAGAFAAGTVAASGIFAHPAKDVIATSTKLTVSKWILRTTFPLLIS